MSIVPWFAAFAYGTLVPTENKKGPTNCRRCRPVTTSLGVTSPRIVDTSSLQTAGNGFIRPPLQHARLD